MERQSVLLIGLGKDGSRIALRAHNKSKRNDIRSLCLSASPLQDIPQNSSYISLSHESSFGEIADMFAHLPDDDRFVGDDIQAVNSARMDCGESPWRTKACLSFAALLQDEERASSFFKAIEDTFINNEKSVKIHFIASCTDYGSGLFLPVTLFIKNFVYKHTGITPHCELYLIGPQIYKNKLSSELYLLSSANMYASVRELNAVYLACDPKTKNDKTIKSSLDFKIGSNDCNMGLLFDSEAPCPSAPYKNISIFEGITGVNSDSDGIEYISNVISSILTDDSYGSLTDGIMMLDASAVYKTHSIVKAVYPKQVISDYIVKRTLTENIYKEWLEIYNNATLSLARYESNDNISQQGLDTKAYLNAMADSPLNVDINTHHSGEEYIEKVLSAIYDTGLCDIVKSTDSFIDKEKTSFISASAFQKNRSVYASAKALHKEFTSMHCKIYGSLDSICSDIISRINGTVSDISLAKEITTEENISVSPIVSFYCLSCIYKALIDKIQIFKSGNPCRYDNEKPYDLIPYDHLRVKSVEQKKNDAYLLLGKERFSNIAEGCRKIKFSSSSAELFFSDAHNIKNNILNSAYAYVLEQITEHILTLADKYILLFNNMNGDIQKLKSEVFLALHTCSDDTFDTVNVFSSPQDKETAFSSYLKLGDDDSIKLSVYNEFAEYILHNDLYEQYDNRLDHLLEKAEGSACKAFMSDSFYKDYIDRNIFDVIFDPLKEVCSFNKSSYQAYINRAFASSHISLSVDMQDDENGYSANKCFSTLILPDSVKDSLLSDDGSSCIDKINKLMLSAGVIPHSIIFSSIIDSNCFYVRQSISNIPPHHFKFFNERENCDGEKACKKAIAVSKSQNSAMWYPYLKPDHHTNGHLPYIAPEMNNIKQEKAAKALLHAVLNDKVFNLPGASDISGVYYIHGDAKPSPVIYNGMPVKLGDLLNLYKWLLDNDAITDIWCLELSKIISAETSTMPVGIQSDNSVQLINSALHKCQFFGRLRDFALLMSFEIHNEHYAEQIIKLTHSILKEYCNRSFPYESDGYYSLYVYAIPKFKNAFADKYLSQFSDEHRKISNIFDLHCEKFIQDN